MIKGVAKTPEQLRAELRLLKKKKKQEKTSGEALSVASQSIEKALEEGNDPAVSEELQRISPEALLAALFVQNQLGVTLLSLGIDRMSNAFFSELGEKMPESTDETVQKMINDNEEQFRRLYYKLLRQIANLKNDKGLNFTKELLTKNILRHRNPLKDIFMRFMDFESLKDTFTDHLYQRQVLEYFEVLSNGLGMAKLAKTLNDYAKYCRCQQAWTKDTTIDPKEDISIYQLPEIGLNILHYFAERGEVRKFVEQATNEHPGSLHLYNEFSCSDETPIDLALSRFRLEDVMQVIKLAQQNRIVRLSVGALNKLLDNPSVYENESHLLELIKLVASPMFTVKGYVKKSTIKFGQYDYVEVCEDGCLLKHLDGRMEFPLFKYIRNSKGPREDILALLTFRELHYKSNVVEYSNFLKINEVIKKITFEGYTRRYYRRVSDVKALLLSSQIQHFDTYIKRVVEIALKQAHEPTLNFIIENIVSNVFVVHLTDGADLFPHLLREVITKKLKKPTELLMAKIAQLTIYQPTLTNADFKSLFDSTMFVHRGVLEDYSTNLLNELLHNFSSITEDFAESAQIKSFLKKEYMKNPSQLNEVYIKGTKLHFVINRIWYFMDPADAFPFYQQFCDFILAKFNEDAKEIEESADPTKKKWPQFFIHYEAALVNDILSQHNDEEHLSIPLPSVAKANSIRRQAPTQHNQFLEYVVTSKNASTTSLLGVLLKSQSCHCELFGRLAKVIARKLSPIPQSLTLAMLQEHKIQSIIDQLIENNRCEQILPIVQGCLSLEDPHSLKHPNSSVEKQSQEVQEQHPAAVFPTKTKELTESKTYLETLLDAIHLGIWRKLTQRNYQQLKTVVDKIDSVVDLSMVEANRKARTPIRTLRSVNEGTVQQVKMFAMLGTDTNFILLEKHNRPTDKKDEAFRIAVECMIKESKSFIEVACFFGIITLPTLKELLRNKSFLRRAAELVSGKALYTKGYTMKTSSFSARLEVLSAAASAWPAEAEQLEKSHQIMVHSQPRRILRYADYENLCGMLDEFLTKTSFINNILKNYKKEDIASYCIDNRAYELLKNFKEGDKEAEKRLNEAVSPVNPFAQSMEEQDCLVDIIVALLEVGKRKCPEAAIKNLIVRHFTPEIFYFYNVVAADSLGPALLLVRKFVDEKTLLAITAASIQPFSSLPSLKEFLCDMGVNLPNTYFKLFEQISANDPKYTGEFRELFCSCLYSLILKQPEVALRQINLAFDNNILEQDDYNKLFQCARMKGNAALILLLLFLSSRSNSFRIMDADRKVVNILAHPIVNMSDSHFKQYLQLALDKVKIDNGSDSHFARSDEVYKRKKLAEVKSEEQDAVQEAPYQREFLQQRLERDYNSCLRAGKWKRGLQIVEGLESIGANLTNFVNNIEQLVKYSERLEVQNDGERKMLCEKIYKIVKKTIKGPVSARQLEGFFKLQPEALREIEVYPLQFGVYIDLVVKTYKCSDSTRLQNKVISDNTRWMQTFGDGRIFLSLVIKQLESYRITLKSAPYYQTLISHFQFVRNYYGEHFQAEFRQQLAKIRTKLVLALETNPAVGCIFEKADINSFPTPLFTNKAVSSYSNLLKILPTLFDDSQKQFKYKKYLLKFGSPAAMRQFAAQRLLKIEDATSVIGSGDLQTTQEFFKQIGMEAAKQLFQDDKNLQTLMVMGREDYSISIIQQLGLQEDIVSFGNKCDPLHKVMNMFDVLCMYRRAKLFHYLVSYLLKSAKPFQVPTEDQVVATSLNECREMARYECRFINQIVTVPSAGFLTRMYLIDPAVLDQQINIFTEIPVFREKLIRLKNVRRLIEGDLDLSTKKEFGLQTYETKKPRFSYTAYDYLLRMVLEIGEPPKSTEITELKIDPISIQIILCLRILSCGESSGQFISSIWSESKLKMPASSLLTLLLLYDPQNKALVNDLQVEYPRETATMKVLRSWYPEGVVLTDDINPVGTILKSQPSKPLENLLFRHLAQQVVALDNLEEIISTNADNCLLLLPEIVKQNKHDLLRKMIDALEKSPGMLFTLVLLLTSNFPETEWFCLQVTESTNPFEMLLKLAGYNGPSFFNYAVKNVRLLGRVGGYHAAYTDTAQVQNDTATMIGAMWTHFMERASIDLQGKFEGIDISMFMEGLKESALAISPREVVRARLGMIKVYSHMLSNLATLQSFKLSVKLNVAVACDSFEGFRRDWLQIILDSASEKSPPFGKIQCLVNITKSDVLESEVNIEQYSRDIVNEAELQLFLTVHKAQIAGLVQAKVAAWHTKHPQHLMDLETIKFDTVSFSKISNPQVIARLFGVGKIGNTDLLFLSRFFDEAESKISDIDCSLTGSLYEIDDVSAPHNSQPDQEGQIEYYPELYTPLPLSSKELELVYVSAEEFIKLKLTSKEKVASDIMGYIQQFKEARINPDLPPNYKFTNCLYYSSNSEGKVSLLPCYYSAWNLLEMYSIVGTVCNELFRSGIRKLAIGFGFQSLLTLLMKILKGSSESSFVEATSKLLKSSNLVSLLHKLFLIMADSGTNIQSVVKGMRVDFAEAKTQPDKLMVLEEPRLSVTSVKYQIRSSVMKVIVNYRLGKVENKPIRQAAIDEKAESLIDQQDLFNCIFSTPEQLTNYFLDRRNLDMEMHRIANSLSQSNSKMVHVSIDYESLYAIVRQLEKTRSIAEIGSLLSGVYNYVRTSLQEKLQNQFSSSKMRLLYQLNLHFLAQTVTEGKDASRVQQMVSHKQIAYTVDKSEPSLRTVHNFINQVAIEHRQHLVNTFMIQIYRRYFMSSFLIGNVYVLGFENRVSVMVAKDRNSINSVDVQNLKWVLWLTRKLPDEVFLDQNMVIGLYICDLAGNFFKLNEKFKSYLLDPEKEDQRQLEVNELIPVLPSNVLLSFVDSELPMMRELSLKRSESTIRSPYESQTVVLTFNTHSGSIKQSEFNYPVFSLVHHFRLSTSIQSRVQAFRKFLTEYHEDTEGQVLQFSFDDSLSDLPEIELFENTLNVCLYELEKVYEEFSKLDSRDKNVEENIATLEPDTLLTKNYLTNQRLKTLRRMFQRLEVCFCQNRKQKESVKFKAEHIILYVDLKSAEQGINFLVVLEALVDQMVARIQFTTPKDLKFDLKREVKIPNFQLNDKLRYLDILLLLNQQATNCQIVNAYNQSTGQPTFNFACEILYSGVPTIKVSGSTATLILVVKESIRLHSFNDILCAANKLTKDPLVNGSRYQFTEYCQHEANISLYNCIEPVASIVIVPLKEFNKAQCTLHPQYAEADGKKKLALILPAAQPYIYIVRTQNTLSYNIADPNLKLEAGNFRVKIGEPVNMCFNILSSEFSVLPLDKIALSYRQDKLVHQLLVPKEHMKVELRHPTRNIISLNYTNNIVSKVVIKNPTLEFPHELLDKTELLEYTIETESFNKICVQNTKCVGILKQGKLVNAPEKDKSANKDDDRFFQPPEKAQVYRLSRQAEIKFDIAEILSGQRPITVAEKQFPFVTKAGHERVEVVVLKDSYGNEIKPDLNDISFVFEYADNPALKMVPTKQYFDETVRLVWEPFVRGRYNLFINDTIVDPGYEIIVSAEEINLEKTKVELPNIRVLSFCEQSSFSVRYRDRYGNIFSDLEHKINKDGVLLELVAFSQEDTVPSKYLQYSVKDVDQFGVQTCQFHINLPDSNEASETEFHLTILFMREDLERFSVKIRGLSIEKRRVLFNNDLNRINKQPQLEIQVVRSSMLEKLVSLVDKDLIRGLSIRFDGEPGVDAGGLKREFYDLVGALMKNQKYPFFKPVMVRNRTCYTLNPELLKNKKKDVYMKTFGKFLASSILNNYLIGIDFADSFVKALYGESIEFTDFKDLVSAEEFNRYEHLLKTKDSEFEDMLLDFTLFENGKEMELQENGATRQVNSSNVMEYLNCIADFKIRKRFQEPIQSFLEGFNSVFSFDVIWGVIQIVKKWFQSREFSIFTCGIKEIQAQSIIDLLIFDNSRPMVEEWFKRYIRECQPSMLGSFLKFTTGASTIPFDTSSYKIEIVFVGASKKLPISHTCWKSLEVPLYKSYEILEKKLNTAFTFGAEGFGFA